MPPGQHAIVLHNFGDASEGCSRIGDPFSLTSTSQSSPSLGDVDGNMHITSWNTSLTLGSSTGIFTRVVDFPVHKVIGRAIAIYKYWNMCYFGFNSFFQISYIWVVWPWQKRETHSVWYNRFESLSIMIFWIHCFTICYGINIYELLFHIPNGQTRISNVYFWVCFVLK